MRNQSMRRWLACGAAAGVLALAAAPALAEAQMAAYSFDQPAQPLADAVQAVGHQTGTNVLVDPRLVDGVKAPALRGQMTSAEAFQLLLASTDLVVQPTDKNSVLIRRKIAADPQGGSAGGGAETNVVQELVVTAQKKSENIQVVPIAISAFTQQDLTTRQVAGGPDLMTQVPNFTFTKTNFSGYSIQIRGIGTQAISATVDPAVAVAFNNTPFIRNRFFEQEFYDLERLEVLRGPQGTLYGRNATAGVVNLISAKPNLSEFEAKASADVGNYSSKRLEGMINIPLVDGKAGLRLAGAWTKRDGYVTNTVTGEPTDGRDLWSGRATLGLEPTSWFKANLIYEHFSENDDRLRSGKQLCHNDPTPHDINGVLVDPTGDPVFSGPAAAVYWTQGCLPASLYSPDSYQTPNGFALPYGPAAGLIGAPIDYHADPYLSKTQPRNLREIETHIKPDYEASNDTVELQLQLQLPWNLTLASETGFNRDMIFSFEDFNRFNTRPGVFLGTVDGVNGVPLSNDVSASGVVCDPQLGCSDRMSAGDLSTAKSLQFSQEFRLSSNYDGPLNFSVGANFLRYDTEDKYYVFFNTLSGQVIASDGAGPLGNNTLCFTRDSNNVGTNSNGYLWSDPTQTYPVSGTLDTTGCSYADMNNIHNLNDEGRNYFLSKNPYHLLSYAAFGEVYYQLTSDLKLTGGFRWTDDQKQAPQIPSWLLAGNSYGTPTLKVIEQEWKEPTGRFAIDWRPKLSFTDETLLYASYTHGYKAGGANPPGYIVVSVPINFPFQQAAQASLLHPETFAPEFVNAYEVGTKNTLLDGSLTFNLDAFYYDYTGYQISQIIDRSAVNLNFNAKIWGSELEIDWRPLKNLRLSLKNGYEHTQLDKGSSAIDIMDRTAGHPGWLVKRPFPTLPSNCIVPVQYALTTSCIDYKIMLLAGPQAGPLPFTAPNNGEGFSKDLSGNELPNAPHFTTTITADYTIPMPHEWLATLHADLYRQSEAWARVFNTPGYDRLKAYGNVNLAAIFSNEASGLQVMAYVKNVFNKTNITGAFLNSDDTGLTTNVFLNEPRLYGVRVTKTWGDDAPFAHWFGSSDPSAYQPIRVELDGDYGDYSRGHQTFVPPAMAYFNPSFPLPKKLQDDLDWGSGGGIKLTYQPDPNSWDVSARVRYGRASGGTELNRKQLPARGCGPFSGYTICIDPQSGHLYKDGSPYISGPYWLHVGANHKYNFYDGIVHNTESHVMADFMVGKEVGIGSGSGRLVASNLSAGVSYAQFNSDSNTTIHIRPDIFFPADNVFKYDSHVHRSDGELDAQRKFRGAGPAVAWQGALGLVGDPARDGRVELDLGASGAVLFGKQTTKIKEHLEGTYVGGTFGQIDHGYITPPYDETRLQTRTKSVSVPAVTANVGLAYTVGRVRVSGGYRLEYYFHAIDGGVETRKTYDRDTNGTYFKVSVGFGG